MSLPGANRSRYARFFASDPGIDPYTRVVSDIYQDLFGEGSFIGKGIYEVDVFEQALKGRFPANRILSHDLLEGCYARAGLLSDVELYENYPLRYAEDVSRRHRWIRGDWQIASWLLPRVPGLDRRREINPLSALSRWKIFDNLRRSLVPAALTLLLFLAWTVLSPPWVWTLVLIAILLVPPWAASVTELFHKPDDMRLRQHLAAATVTAGRHFAQAAFALACLPYEAFFSLDAILRTAARLLITRRRLLEWNPSADSSRSGRPGFLASGQTMWIAPVIGLAASAYLALSRPAALGAAGPILGLWFASPVIAWWLSRPIDPRGARLTADQILFLRKISRKTWAFFETFVGPEDHWLPPDGYQEYRVAQVAHRTSPTNIGLSLLANLSAYDFGFLTAGQLIERTANAFGTMEALDRYRGHFYNWYDTQSLKPLPPLYISSVDSGNLSGHLLTLRPGLLALADDTIIGARWREGLGDTLSLLMETAGEAAPAPIAQLQRDLQAAAESRPVTLQALRVCLERLAMSTAEVVAGVEAFDAVPESPARRWAQHFAGQFQAVRDELAFLAPWTFWPAPPERLCEVQGLGGIPTLRQVANLDRELRPAIEQRLGAETTSEERAWLAEFRRVMPEAIRRARSRMAAIDRLVLQSGELARMEYGFLMDETSHLLAIGYNVTDRRRDKSFYDLLASEARLCSFVGIAQGQLPQESWFALGRLLTNSGGETILVSWSGSMFEYLMPLLVMPTYENTLLDQTCKGAVESQIAYGKKRKVPWGISESGYNAVDAHLNYQYRAFGVPGLGLKRGLADDLVVAPYATAMALMVAPEEACLNLERLAAEGVLGEFGFYEAVDYTPSRQPRGQSSVAIRSFMAHHEGMSLLSLAYVLLGRPMQKRFESDPMFQATTLLLQERIPKAAALSWQTAELSDVITTPSGLEMPTRVFGGPDTPTPEVQLLSNGRYHVMITNAGGGYSRWKNIDVTRWREDATCDNWGTFCYLRDVTSGECWSTTYQPTLKRTEMYEAIFSEARAEFRCRQHDLDTHTEIAVSPEDDIEMRRVTITNRGRSRRVIDVTSYAEVVLASPAADALHPAFSNLFVQTEILRHRQAILCTRRPRSLSTYPMRRTACGSSAGETPPPIPTP